MSENDTSAEPASGVWTTDQPTYELRWSRTTGRLQQRWIVTRCEPGKVHVNHHEWRDVRTQEKGER